MGLQAYYVRRGLPFAAPGVDYEFPHAEDESESTGPRAEPLTPRPNQGLEDIRKSLRTSKSDRQPAPLASSPEEANVTPGNAPEFAPALRFRLAFYALGELAVLSELPFEVAGDDASNQDQLQLLRNILLALGIAVDEAELAGEMFTWPLQFSAVSPAQVPDPAAAATSALNGYLLQKSEQHGFTQLLAFAGITEPLLQSLKESSSATGFELTVTSNLRALLAVPALKRAVWEDIRGLRVARAERNRAD